MNTEFVGYARNEGEPAVQSFGVRQEPLASPFERRCRQFAARLLGLPRRAHSFGRKGPRAVVERAIGRHSLRSTPTTAIGILPIVRAAAFSSFPPVHTNHLERVLRVELSVWDLDQLRAGDVRIAPSFAKKPATSSHSCATPTARSFVEASA